MPSPEQKKRARAVKCRSDAVLRLTRGLQWHKPKKERRALRNVSWLRHVKDQIYKRLGSTTQDKYVSWDNVLSDLKHAKDFKDDMLDDVILREHLGVDADKIGIYIPKQMTEAEREYIVKDFADSLLDVFAKGEGYDTWEQKKEIEWEQVRRENKYGPCWFYPADISMVLGDFEYCEENKEPVVTEMDCIDSAMANYEQPMWDRKNRFIGYRTKISKDAWRRLPYEEQNFPTGNYELSRQCVQALVSAHSWVLTSTGWRKKT